MAFWVLSSKQLPIENGYINIGLSVFIFVMSLNRVYTDLQGLAAPREVYHYFLEHPFHFRNPDVEAEPEDIRKWFYIIGKLQSAFNHLERYDYTIQVVYDLYVPMEKAILKLNLEKDPILLLAEFEIAKGLYHRQLFRQSDKLFRSLSQRGFTHEELTSWLVKSRQKGLYEAVYMQVFIPFQLLFVVLALFFFMVLQGMIENWQGLVLFLILVLALDYLAIEKRLLPLLEEKPEVKKKIKRNWYKVLPVCYGVLCGISVALQGFNEEVPWFAFFILIMGGWLFRWALSRWITNRVLS